jgi:hypothetical protein
VNSIPSNEVGEQIRVGGCNVPDACRAWVNLSFLGRRRPRKRVASVLLLAITGIERPKSTNLKLVIERV